MENKKKIYTVTITDENGEVFEEVKTDCILLSANCLGDGATRALAATSCTGETIIKTIMGLDKIKKDLIKKNPIMGLMLAMQEAAESVSVGDNAQDAKAENDCGIKIVEEQP